VRGVENRDVHRVPVIRNTPREAELVEQLQTALADPRFAGTYAVIVADKLTDADVFKRTYLGHGSQSSAFVFQGHPGPFRTHVHVTHDEIGYVLEGNGSVTVGGVTRPVKQGDVWIIPANTPHGGVFEDAPQVLFISSPIDDPDNQDRVWLD
jgi:quercetin dioxygenase-like cupin family protein